MCVLNTKQFYEFARKHNLKQEVIDEMAIPSYNHYSPFVKWMFFKRLDELTENIDFSNKNILMYPIEINSTNILVSKINFFQNDNRLVFDLQDEPEPSHLSIKIPKSMIKNLEDLNVSSETSLANDGKTLIRLPHKVQSTTNNDFSIITLEIPEDYSKDDNLQFSLQPSELSVTKTIPEFGLAQIILLLSICILFIFSKNISSFRV